MNTSSSLHQIIPFPSVQRPEYAPAAEYAPIDSIPQKEYHKNMWEVEYTDEFGEWRETLNETEKKRVAFSVGLLGQFGPALKFPHCTDVRQSKHSAMRNNG